MKELKTHVTIPRQPKTGLDVLTWAKDVNYAIRQLASKKVYGINKKRPTKTSRTSANSHPWKVTNGGYNEDTLVYTLNISAGKILGYYMTCTESSSGVAPSIDGAYSPDTIVMANGGTYAGGSLSLLETKYIYAEVPRNGVTDNYSEAKDNGVTVELGDDIKPTLAGAATIISSTLAPDFYIPTSGYAAVCIALASIAGGVLTITQYVTHNPTLAVPSVNVVVSEVEASHPWKATAGGGSTIDIAPGKILSFPSPTSGAYPNLPLEAAVTSYAGGNVAITGSGGTVYLVVNLTQVIASDDTFIWSMLFTVSSITVEVDPAITGSKMFIPIASATLAGGVASVASQTLTHNPHLQIGYALQL